jgi:hypothetical protein
MNKRGVATAVPWWSRALDQFTWRFTLVLTMIVVGVSGACVAYMVGVHELQATYFERELMQNNVLAMNERQMLLDLNDAHAEFRRRVAAANARGQAYLAAASSQQQALNADLLSLRAQEEFAASRALQPFVTATRSSWDGAQDEGAIQRRVARNVAKSGRESDESTDFTNMWHRLEERIKKGHEKVRKLAIAVVLFVASLVMFTFAGLTSKRMAQALLFGGVGFAGIAAIGVMTIIPERLAPSVVLVLLGICSVLAWKVGPPSKAAAEGHAEPAEGDPHGFAKGLHPPHASVGARNVVRWIAVTVLLSSMSGLGYSFATTASSEATHEALRAEIEMHLRNTKRQAEALDRLHRSAQFQEERARFSATAQRAAYFRSIDATAAELAAAEARAFQLLSEDGPALQLQLLRLSDDFNKGAQDPRFLRGTLRRIDPTHNEENHWESTAFWDLHNQRSLASSRTAAAFLWTITVFAVALYFFGQAIGMKKGITGRVLNWTGRGLVCIALVYAVYVFFVAQCRSGNGELACRRTDAKKPTSAEVHAASRYAYAHALLSDARTDDDYARAIDALSSASETLPEWRLAQIDFVSAVARQVMFSADESFLHLPRKEGIAKTKDTMDKALAKVKDLNGQRFEQRKEPVSLLVGLGRYTWLDAIVKGHAGDVDRSIVYLKRASKRAEAGDGTDIDAIRIELNLAVVHTLRGDEEEADKHMASALKKITDSKSPNARNSRLIARAMTDFEIVTKYCPKLKAKDCPRIRTRIDQLKEGLVAAVWGGAPVRTSAVRVKPGVARDIALSITSTTATWLGSLGSFGPNDTLAVVWYRFDDEWKVWRALHEISGRVEATELTPAEIRVERQYFKSTDFARCLSGDGEGKYRAEFYINGRRIEVNGETTFLGSRYQAAQLHDLNVALCRPAEWVAEQNAASASDGTLERGWKTEANEMLLKVYAFHLPKAAPSARDTGVNNPVQLLKATLTKSGWTNAAQQTYLRYDRGNPADCEAMMRKGAFVYVDWETPDGMRYIGVAAPVPDFAVDRPRALCQVLDSMTPLNAMSDLQQKGSRRSHTEIRAAGTSSSGTKEP